MDVTQAQWVFLKGDTDVSSVDDDVNYSEDLIVNFSELTSDQTSRVYSLVMSMGPSRRF